MNELETAYIFNENRLLKKQAAELKAQLEKAKKDAKRPKTLPSVKPNLGLELKYRRALETLCEQMAKDFAKSAREFKDAKRKLEIARDKAIKPSDLDALLSLKEEHWTKAFAQAAEKMAEDFVTGAQRRTKRDVIAKLKKIGITIGSPYLTPLMRAKIAKHIRNNVEMINTVPKEYFGRIRHAVELAVIERGGDLALLTRELAPIATVAEDVYSVKTLKQKIAFWVRDQSNKATQDLAAQEAKDAGVTHGRWQHIRGLKTSRDSHIRMDGVEFNLAEGMYDDDPKIQRHVQPGELYNCNCKFQIVVPGIDDYNTDEEARQAEIGRIAEEIYAEQGGPHNARGRGPRTTPIGDALPEGWRWITLANGRHVLLDGEGTIQSGRFKGTPISKIGRQKRAAAKTNTAAKTSTAPKANKSAGQLKSGGNKGIIKSLKDVKEIKASGGKKLSVLSITGIKSFTGNSGDKKPLRVESHLLKQYGGTPGKWKHNRGTALVDDNGIKRKAEIHLFSEPSIGHLGFKWRWWIK